MSISLKIVDPLEVKEWNRNLDASARGSFFHTSNWARVLVESYGYRPVYFCGSDGVLSSLIPIFEIQSAITGKRGVSLPFSDYAVPIFNPDLDHEEIMEFLLAYGRKVGWKYLEIRDSEYFPARTPVIETYFGHLLDLRGSEADLFSRFRDSTKRNIRKAVKETVQVGKSSTIESMRQFYRLNCMTRKEHGLPPQPWRFFRKVHEHVIANGLGFVALASFHGKFIAGSVYFHFGEGAIYKYGASDKAFQNIRANNLVMWEAIRWCREAGYSNLCFGRTETENQGLLQFKDGWGASRREIKYFRYDLRSEAYVAKTPNKGSIYTAIFRALPIPILKMAGNVLYRHVG